MSAASGEFNILLIIMAGLSSYMSITWIRTWFSIAHGFRPEKCQDALCITLCHTWRATKTRGGFSAAMWMCPCLSICLSWLSLSVLCWLCMSACFCTFLSPFYHFLKVFFSFEWSPSMSCLNQFLFPLCCLSLSSFLSPSFLTPSFCPSRTWFSSSQSQMD